MAPATARLAELRGRTEAYRSLKLDIDAFWQTVTAVDPATPAGQAAELRYNKLRERRDAIGNAQSGLGRLAIVALISAIGTRHREHAFALMGEINVASAEEHGTALETYLLSWSQASREWLSSPMHQARAGGGLSGSL